MGQYRTAPLDITTMPSGIGYIVGNEAAERFSFYGMKAILTVYMTQDLVDWSGAKAPMSPENAKATVHAFVASAYFFPILGAILADWLWGKYPTIVWLSLVYCLGHLLLAVVPGHEGLFAGLLLIAIGAGGIKPCVSAHVGDQFGPRNQDLLSRVFGWFYFSINFGAFFSTLLTPYLRREYGAHVAFGVPAVLMFIATVVFWLGRNRYAHVPPQRERFWPTVTDPVAVRAIIRLVPLYLFISVFWALYDQTASAWVLQAEKMDRRWLGVDWDASQIQAVNPILVMMLIPWCTYFLYPVLGKVIRLTPLRKIAMGLFLTAMAFAISAFIEQRITLGHRPNISLQVWAYVVLTLAEVMVSITALEFSYTQAPAGLKSIVMSVYLLSVSLGNLLTSAINYAIQRNDGSTILPGASYYWFFTAMMAITAVLFLGYLAVYSRVTQPADSDPATP
jgi:proton-dependent oligopeptide transporter, POT family